MKNVITLTVVSAVAAAAMAMAAAPEVVSQGNDAPARIRALAEGDDVAWQRLESLCDRIGPRLAGSEALAKAADWAEGLLRQDGQAGVHRETAEVPHWIRGEERLEMLAPEHKELQVIGLGGTVGTEGIEAPVTVVHDFAELGPTAAGTIVVYDVAMDPDRPGGGYGSAVRYRTRGASEAAKHGAVAVLVRSLATGSLATPHTGVMRYEADVPRIPAAAITTEMASEITRLVGDGVAVRLRLVLRDHDEGSAPSANVMGELKGSSRPEEVVVLGAHLDSWDVGEGAQDDGVGVVQVVEALRLLRALGIEPARTIRAVLYTSEEWGGQGGRAYASAHANEKHVAAIESDFGGGMPEGWGASGTREQLGWVLEAARATGLPVSFGGGGTDIGPLEGQGTVLVGMRPESRHYFEVHHSRADTLDKVDPAALRSATAAMAILAWELANR